MIGLIGCGNIGTALVEGITAAGFCSPHNFIVYDQDISKAEKLQLKTKLKVAPGLAYLCQEASQIFIAVKPQDMSKLLLSIKPYLTEDHLLISLAAGLTISFFQERLNNNLKIIRLMPNTPSLIGEGIIAACKSERVSHDEAESVLALLKPLGKVLSLEEKYFDAVTALSGSGPAYIFLIIEALTDGGVEVGLPRDIAQLLAAQTVAGAAKMVLTTGLHPAVLKSQVTSPGGVTSAALLTLEEEAIRASIIKALKVGTLRSEEIGGSWEARK